MCLVPTISAAAAAAGRPAPRIAAGVPASVTADPERTRAHAFDYLGGNARNPSYQAALEREGISHPADLALAGDEETVAAGLRRYLEAGATDVRVSPAAFAADEDACGPGAWSANSPATPRAMQTQPRA